MPEKWEPAVGGGGSGVAQQPAIADTTDPSTWGSMKGLDTKVNEIITALEGAGVTVTV